MNLSPELISHSVILIPEILLLIFAFRFRHYDPKTEESPYRQLSLVCEQWRGIVLSLNLNEAFLDSPGWCLQILRCSTKLITENNNMFILKKALELKSLDVSHVCTLLSKCHDTSTLQTVGHRLRSLPSNSAYNKDWAIGRILEEYTRSCAETGDICVLEGLTEFFRTTGIRSVWSVITGQLNKPYDFSNYQNSSEAFRSYLISGFVDFSKYAQFPLHLIAKLWIVETFFEDSNETVYQNIAIEIICRMWKDDQRELFKRFMKFFDSMSLPSGMSMGAQILFVPLAFASMSDLGDFFHFFRNTGYDLEELIKGLENIALFSDSIECLNMASSLRFIMRLINGDPAAYSSSLCFMPSINMLVGYEHTVSRFNFNIVQFRQVISLAENTGLSGGQAELMMKIFDAAYHPFKWSL